MLGKIKKDDLMISVRQLPVLSKIVSSALELIDDPNCSVRELAELISKDQSITAKIIKLANSAFYGFPRRIGSLSEAFIIVGFKNIRSLLITASVSDLFKGKMDGCIVAKGELWKHSYAVAFAAGSISKITRLHDSDTAFTVGIVHDLGKLILGNYLKNHYGDVMTLAKKNKMPLSKAEENILGYSHATVGGMILDHWNFPENMVLAVANHHDDFKPNIEPDQLGDILHLADCWVIGAGIGIYADDSMFNVANQYQRKLSVSDEARDEILANLTIELEAMSEIFFEESKGVSLSVIQ